jgi:hypothetical protein
MKHKAIAITTIPYIFAVALIAIGALMYRAATGAHQEARWAMAQSNGLVLVLPILLVIAGIALFSLLLIRPPRASERSEASPTPPR